MVAPVQPRELIRPQIVANEKPPQPVVIPKAVAVAQQPAAPPVPHKAPTAHSHQPRSLGGKFLTESFSISSLEVCLKFYRSNDLSDLY